MQDILTLSPVAHVQGVVRLPGSKSLSNRALLLASLAKGKTRLHNLLDSDDVRHMLNALKAFGVDYKLTEDRTCCEIVGKGLPLCTKPMANSLFLGNAGTAMRPLVASLSLNNSCFGDIILTGEKRMKERPIEHLVDALCQGGAKIQYLEEQGYPPLAIKGGFVGGNITLDASLSSQFLTALLLAAPLASNNTKLNIKGDVVSKPYVAMTLKLMEDFGVTVKQDSEQSFQIEGQQCYQSPGDYWIEGDASSASYFLAAAAIRGGEVRVLGVGRKSIQGDIHFADALEKMGAQIQWDDNSISCKRGTLEGIDIDANAIPDAAMTLATTALFARGSTKLRNIYNWRLKETDRLAAMAAELRKVGAIVKEEEDSIHITPPEKLRFAEIETYNDHRMAMCFSLVSLSNMPVAIKDPGCTAKTFPNYFDLLRQISQPLGE